MTDIAHDMTGLSSEPPVRTRRRSLRAVTLSVAVLAAVALSACSTPAKPDAPTEPKLKTWADTVYGSFEPVLLAGSGDKTVEVPDGVDAAFLTFEHSGDGDFTVEPMSQAESDWLKEAEEVSPDDAASASVIIPEISGTLAGNGNQAVSGLWGVDRNDAAPAVSFRVTAVSSWTLQFVPVSSLPSLNEQGSGSGTFLYGGESVGVTFDSSGEEPFTVTEYSAALTQGLVNSDEDTPKSVNISAGPTVIQIHASGSWLAVQK